MCINNTPSIKGKEKKSTSQHSKAHQSIPKHITAYKYALLHGWWLPLNIYTHIYAYTHINISFNTYKHT